MSQFPAAGSGPADDRVSTSLKWGSDGELSPVDLQRVLERLQVPTLMECPLRDERI
ncbi:hypothetical protein [Vulcanococcus limneticus]|uniref:hypothetical protein n=1 Tax=Vulcanococcus limneticus TaxID=2170428 RepID=UPI0018E35F6B|nr:hypothetical protein [Vulcanococcus limneticus]MCP9792794.1 hypothetical protein [Vulcanococcus limneticus MW73D5]MCP9894708.1 hypothetical protein [Vulcanococcus limneticus Candia 3F8]MCP9898186.1 hypothetical protein [Vulcanococcus limneticus Candia 3B3]